MTLERQLNLESDMLSLGTEKYINSVDAKNDFDSIHLQTIIKKIIEPFSSFLGELIQKEKTEYKRGHKPNLLALSECVCTTAEFNKTKQISTEQISFVVCRLLFNSIRSKPHKMVKLGYDIGNTINTNIIFDDKLSDTQAFRTGVNLIHLFTELYPELVYYERGYFDSRSSNLEYLVYPSDEFMDFIDEKIEAIADMTVVMMPMVYKPCDWNSLGKDGGYYSHELKKNIIKRKSIEDDSGINELIANGINLIQSTPWRVNQFVKGIIDVLNKTKPESLKKLYPIKIPLDEERPFDMNYADMNDEQKKVHKLWSRQTKRNEKRREAKKSVEISRYASLRQSNKFFNDEKIYFPHDADYRIRSYNRCMTGLNTQGDDNQKGLIQLANSRPVITDSGVRWMSINMANLAGQDKLKLDERYAWCVNNEMLLRDVVKDPIKCTLWHSWDKPIQGLAAAKEYVKWLDNPEESVNIHVQLDGLCYTAQT